jgi:hypothetical protein
MLKRHRLTSTLLLAAFTFSGVTAAAQSTSGTNRVALGEAVGLASATVAPDPEAITRQWGYLAQMAGTSWREGQEIYTYRWMDIGREMRVTVAGQFGTRVVRILAKLRSNILAYSSIDLDSQETEVGTITAKKDHWIEETHKRGQVFRTEFGPEGQVQYVYRYNGPAGKNLMQVVGRAQISEEDASRSIRNLKITYPARPQGSYPKDLGVLGLMAGGEWVETQRQDAGSPVRGGYKGTSSFLLAGETGQEKFFYVPMEGPPGTVLDPEHNLVRVFSRKANGAFIADSLNSSSAQPEGTAAVNLVVVEGGVAVVNDVNNDSVLRRRSRWYLSADGRHALDQQMYWDAERGWVLAVNRFLELKSVSRDADLLTRLDGHIFRTGSGYFAIHSNGWGGFTINRNINKNGVGKAYFDDICTGPKNGNQYTCTGNRDDKPVTFFLVIGPSDSFILNGVVYRLTPSGLEVAQVDGKAYQMPTVPLPQFAIETGNQRDVALINKNYQQQARNAQYDRERQAENDRMWAGIIGTLAKGLSSPGNAYTQVQTDWDVAGSVNAQYPTVGGSGRASDMGSVRYEPVPAGHDSVYYTQAQIDDFMNAHHANDAPAPTAAISTYSPQYHMTTGAAVSSSTAGGSKSPTATGSPTHSNTDGLSPSTATSSGNGSAGAAGQNTSGGSSVSQTSGNRSSSSQGNSNNAIIVGPPANQAADEALARRNAQAQAQAAADAAAQQKLNEAAAAQSAAEERARLDVLNGPSRPKTCGAGTNQPSCPTSPR